MVALASSAPEMRERRMAALLGEAGLPGAEEDHAWIARRLNHCLCRVEPWARDRESMEPLLVSGLLLEMGRDPSRVPELRGRCFPEAWLRSVPPLLKSGFPETAWRLVEASVLTVDGRSVDGRRRWRVEGGALHPLIHAWYELGNQLSADTLAKALVPLSREEEAGIQVRVAGLSLLEAKNWAGELRRSLEARAHGARVHVLAG